MPTRRPKAFFWFVILAVIYVLLSLLLPPNTATVNEYHLTDVAYRVLVLFIDLPVLAVWFAAFYGYARLDKYALAVKLTQEGKPFTQIARGLRWLAWGMALSSIFSSLLGGIAHSHPGFGKWALIINHYLSLIIAIIAFTIINTGTRGLSDTTRTKPSLLATRWLSVGFIFLAMSYCFATIRAVQNASPNPYQLPMWLILFTIIMPYLYAWLMGLLAAFDISVYRKQVRGMLYKRALNLLAVGITMAIFASIALQYLVSSSPYLRRVTFNWVLLIAYIILTIYAVGFILIAMGADRLKKIEEV